MMDRTTERSSVDTLKEDFEETINAMPAAIGNRTNFFLLITQLELRQDRSAASSVIPLKAGQRDLVKLRPGMSVEPKVSLD